MIFVVYISLFPSIGLTVLRLLERGRSLERGQSNNLIKTKKRSRELRPLFERRRLVDHLR